MQADEPIVIPQFVPKDAATAKALAEQGKAGKASEAPSAAHSSEPSAAVWHQRHDDYFRRNWGIEILGVRHVSSGYMLEFKYRILDSAKAAVLNEKRSKAFVIDEATDTRLAVPAMENIGELRQSSSPEEGRVYYIIFGNPGKLVKKDGHVDVVIGRFRADGIVVE